MAMARCRSPSPNPPRACRGLVSSPAARLGVHRVHPPTPLLEQPAVWICRGSDPNPAPPPFSAIDWGDGLGMHAGVESIPGRGPYYIIHA